MEKISTSRAALLPRAANLATLAVVVSATWWSGAQRPAGQAVLAVVDKAPAAGLADTAAQRQPALMTAQTTTTVAEGATTAGTATTATTATNWSAQAASLAREGLQAISYQTRTHR